jgi:flagellum-specific ATP synthase
MTLRLNTEVLRAMANRLDGFRIGGKLRSVQSVIKAGLPAAVGELCEIHLPNSAAQVGGRRLLGEVIASSAEESQIMTFRHPQGVRPGLEVVASGRSLRVPVGDGVLGRTLNGLGEPVDGGPPLSGCRLRPINTTPPIAMERLPITKPFITGQRCIDSLLTLGVGQRVGLFAGSGVGKSTLMGEIAKHAAADMNVIALIGERGREVRPFIEDCLQDEGKRRSVVVVATSDETPLMRIQAVKTAIEIASDFRDQGGNVLFFLDSVTRLAHAQRELGLSRGETPGTRGYPPSVHNLLANSLERLGNNDYGSITGIITVLVDGDDMDEPIADAARSILDGHLVLDRKLAAKGHFPAINVLHSVSRLFREVTSQEHQRAATDVRENLTTYEDIRDLIQVGLYQQGTLPEVDQAIRLMPRIESFLKQQQGEHSSWTATSEQLMKLAG